MTARSWRTAIQGDAGFPDIVAVRGDRMLFAELKAEKGKLSAEQEEWIATLKASATWLSGSRARWHPQVYVWRPQGWPEIERVLA